MQRSVALFLLVACGSPQSGDTDTDTDTDPSSEDSFGSFDDAPDTFTSFDSGESFGDTTTSGDPGTSSSSSSDGPTEASDTDSSSSSSSGSDSGSESDPTLGDPGNCCESHPEKTGCENMDVEACVCEEDMECCDLTWDDACVVGVVIYGCGECEGIGGDGDCCMAHDNPGCDDDEIEACVCAMDIACCNDQWDQICVDEVADLRCGMCA